SQSPAKTAPDRFLSIGSSRARTISRGSININSANPGPEAPYRNLLRTPLQRSGTRFPLRQKYRLINAQQPTCIGRALYLATPLPCLNTDDSLRDWPTSTSCPHKR